MLPRQDSIIQKSVVGRLPALSIAAFVVLMLATASVPLSSADPPSDSDSSPPCTDHHHGNSMLIHVVECNVLMPILNSRATNPCATSGPQNPVIGEAPVMMGVEILDATIPGAGGLVVAFCAMIEDTEVLDSVWQACAIQPTDDVFELIHNYVGLDNI